MYGFGVCPVCHIRYCYNLMWSLGNNVSAPAMLDHTGTVTCNIASYNKHNGTITMASQPLLSTSRSFNSRMTISEPCSCPSRLCHSDTRECRDSDLLSALWIGPTARERCPVAKDAAGPATLLAFHELISQISTIER